MALDTLFALGLLLTNATQLRLPGLPVGPGEVCLAMWVVLLVCWQLSLRGSLLTPALRRLVVFWALFAIAESIGTVTGFTIGDIHDSQLFWHDIMAYPLIVAVSLASVVGSKAHMRLRRVSLLLVTFGTAALLLQLAVAARLLPLSLFDPWYWDRLRGWSANPDQLALLCVVLALLSLSLVETAGRASGRTAAVGCLIVAVCAGRLTGSDTSTAAIVMAGPLFLGLSVYRSALAPIAVIALPLTLGAVVPLAVSIGADSQDLVMSLAKHGGKEAREEADLRLWAWRTALERGVEAGMLGLGPGPICQSRTRSCKRASPKRTTRSRQGTRPPTARRILRPIIPSSTCSLRAGCWPLSAFYGSQ